MAADEGQSSAKTGSAGAQRWQSGQSDASQQTGGSGESLQSQQSDTSQQTGGSEESTEHKIKKSGKPKTGNEDGVAPTPALSAR